MLDIYSMCGIAGILSVNPANIRRDILQKMTDTIAHRGPDGEGFWINPAGNMGFGHRRLSIIDLSALAAQPMHYQNRYTIVYNGEIYNYVELRETLRQKGYAFHSASDTEVILAAYDCYRETCLQHFDGMFSFAIWDQQEQELFCARDRFGEKPFYYSFTEDQFSFASEKKSLWAAGIPKKINLPLLLNFIALGHTQTAADSTITFHQDIFSLPPSHYLKIGLPAFEFNMHRYWDADKETTQLITEKDAAEKLWELLATSVKRRLRSDVPVGTSLSGGLDSSSILSAIKQVQPGNTGIHSFSAVFPGFAKDESAFIQKASEQFHIPNFQTIPSAADLIKNFEKICYHQEEPFSSSSTYAQFAVFGLAKEHGVKVLLDGQGADELMGGYDKYIPWYLLEVWRKNPLKLRNELKAFKDHDIRFDWGWKNYLAALFPMQVPSFLEKREVKKIRRNKDLDPGFINTFLDVQSFYKPLVMKLNDILYFNSFQFGLEELLRYADRNSMAHGREVRLPFLNHELVSFICSLPGNYKMRTGWTKWILRTSAAPAVPAEIVWRKDKVGYETPQKKWMEDPVLKDYVHEAKKKLAGEGVLRASAANKKNQPLDAYAADNYDWRYLVAAAFM